MADEETPKQGLEPDPTDDTPDPGGDSGEKTFSADYVAELRQEAAGWRKKLRDAEKNLEAIESEKKNKKQQELVDNEQWKTLAEERAEELKKLQAQIRDQNIQQMRMQTIQELGLPADALEFLTGDDQETIKAQGEKFKSLLPDASEAGSQLPRQQKRPAVIPGGEPTGETREQKNRRLGLTGSRSIIQ